MYIITIIISQPQHDLLPSLPPSLLSSPLLSSPQKFNPPLAPQIPSQTENAPKNPMDAPYLQHEVALRIKHHNEK